MQSPPRSTFRTALTAALSSGSGHLVERAMQLAALDRQLRQSLPESLASHAWLGNLHAGRLVFLVDSPIWVRRLHEHAGVLLHAARAIGVQADGIDVKVATMRPAPTDMAPAARLSTTARDTLRSAAAATRDEELRSLLLHLASMA